MNPNEAPEGYVAKKWLMVMGCKKCVFYDRGMCTNIIEECFKDQRRDKTSVYFVKKESPPPKKEKTFPVWVVEFVFDGEGEDFYRPDKSFFSRQEARDWARSHRKSYGFKTRVSKYVREG